MTLIDIDRALAAKADALQFGDPVAYVYNPLTYAWAPHERYVSRYATGQPEVLLLGMNPGPFGMAQTGVPFGDVTMVREWLKIDDAVSAPPRTHPKRPVQGFACTRKEVSGSRLWGWARERFKTPERFFQRFFVLNYCPLIFLEDSGRNRTPDKLASSERAQLTAICDDALRATVDHLRPRIVVGVGVYARDAARRALADTDVAISCVLHPSPASPKANRGWAPQAEQELAAAGIKL